MQEVRGICHGAINGIRILIVDVERASSYHPITGVTTAFPQSQGQPCWRCSCFLILTFCRGNDARRDRRWPGLWTWTVFVLNFLYSVCAGVSRNWQQAVWQRQVLTVRASHLSSGPSKSFIPVLKLVSSWCKSKCKHGSDFEQYHCR